MEKTSPVTAADLAKHGYRQQWGVIVMREQDNKLATWEPSLTGAPRLFRPELRQIGFLPDGFRILK